MARVNRGERMRLADEAIRAARSLQQSVDVHLTLLERQQKLVERLIEVLADVLPASS